MDWPFILLSVVVFTCVAIWAVWIRKGYSTLRNTAFWAMVLITESTLLAVITWTVATWTHGFGTEHARLVDRIVAIGLFSALAGMLLGLFRNRHTGKTWLVPLPVGFAMFLFWTAASGT